jgi:hypothetical protein
MIARKAHWAALACTLWLLGFDVVPLAHLVFHEALEDHHHGHDHHHPLDDDSKAPSPLEHGEGSVAHRDLAANVPLPQVPRILEALLTCDAPKIVSHDERPTERRPRTTRARAPPRVTA